MTPRRAHAVGIAIALSGVLVISPDAAIVRLIDAGPGTILLWRGPMSGLLLVALVALSARGRLLTAFRSVGRAGVLVAVLLAISHVSFVVSITHANAANVLVIVATVPMFTAILSRITLGEAVPHRTWLAIAIVLAAVALVFSGVPTLGVPGEATALGGALSQAAAVTTIRRSRAVSMLPAFAVAMFLVGAAGLALGGQVPQGRDVGLLVLLGAVLTPVAVALVGTAPRFIPAAEASLIGRLEMVLGPLWVFALIGERPTQHAIVAGAIILVTLTLHTVAAVRESTQDAALDRAPIAGGPSL
jgi:drug/metabolite transporter (DMT)-like permease